MDDVLSLPFWLRRASATGTPVHAKATGDSKAPRRGPCFLNALVIVKAFPAACASAEPWQIRCGHRCHLRPREPRYMTRGTEG